jgi:hypothetical protein
MHGKRNNDRGSAEARLRVPVVPIAASAQITGPDSLDLLSSVTTASTR